LGPSSLSVPLSTRSTVRRHQNFDVAGTYKEVDVFLGRKFHMHSSGIWAFTTGTVQLERTTAGAFNYLLWPELQWNIEGSWRIPGHNVPCSQQRHLSFHCWGRLPWTYHWRHVQLSAVTWTSMSLERIRKLACCAAKIPDLHCFDTWPLTFGAVQLECTTDDTLNCPPSPELRCRWNAEGSWCVPGEMPDLQCFGAQTFNTGAFQLECTSLNVKRFWSDFRKVFFSQFHIYLTLFSSRIINSWYIDFR